MKYSPVLQWLPAVVLILFQPGVIHAELPLPTVIVIGFVGGFVRQNNTAHEEVQLATHLRKDYPSGMDAEIFENHSGQQAHQEILRLLDTDGSGTLSADERLKARIVLYGHSWGASEAVTMARALEKDGIPVLLTIQVDSVSKLPAKMTALSQRTGRKPSNFISWMDSSTAGGTSSPRIHCVLRFWEIFAMTTPPNRSIAMGIPGTPGFS